MDAGTGSTRQHVFCVTSPAYGHIIPLLELARKISHFHDVTFAVSANTLPRMMDRELIKPSDQVTFYPIEDGVVTDYDNPGDMVAMTALMQAVGKSVAELLAKIPKKNKDASTSQPVNGLRPIDVAIVDMTTATAVSVCIERNIPCYMFFALNATSLHTMMLFDADWPTVPDAEADCFITDPTDEKRVPIGEAVKIWLLPMQEASAACNGYIVNTNRHLESEVVKVIEDDPVYGKSIFCIGPLLPDTMSSDSRLTVENKVSDWLDRQDDHSVVYISFGSAAIPAPEQVAIIGQALLDIGKPVIWSLQDRDLGSLAQDITAKIPGQFDDPNNKFLILNWVPQKIILAHKSVAVFVSHCGWNSTLEAFSAGIPLIAWPMCADERIDGEMAERLGAGIMIPGTGMNATRIVPEQEIKHAILTVGGWRAGRYVKSRQAVDAKNLAVKLQASVTPGGSSYFDFQNLIKLIGLGNIS